jgi:hypothetical protein
MAAVKAKEKEMKDEKEAERQVSTGLYTADIMFWMLICTCREEYKRSRTSVLRRRRRPGTRSWRRRCIGSESRD